MKLQFKTEMNLLQALGSKSPSDYNAALAYLYNNDKLRNTVRKIVFSLGGSEADVAGVFNDALNIVFNHVQDGIYNPAKSHLTTYITSIAKKRFYTTQRSERRRLNAHLGIMEANADEISSDLNKEMDRTEQTALLSRVLNEIDPKCQSLTELQSIGYSLAEIAEKLNFKNQNVAKSAAQNCRDKFRKQLETRRDLVDEILGL